jgi:hypothetical protein
MRIADWSRFQGYKKRGPDWIKLHLSLLDQPQYLRLPIVAQAVLPSLWITAARISEEGELPDDLAVLAVLSHRPEAQLREALPSLIAAGWIVCDEVVAGTATELSGEREESERERERESVAPPSAPPAQLALVERPAKPAPKPSWSAEACDGWKAHLGTAPGDRIGKALRPLVTEHGWDKVRPVWQAACESAASEPDPSYFTPEVFARTFKARLTAPKARASPRAPVTEQNKAVLDKWEAEVAEGKR